MLKVICCALFEIYIHLQLDYDILEFQENAFLEHPGMYLECCQTSMMKLLAVN